MRSVLSVSVVLASLALSGCVLVPVGPPGSGAYAAVPAVRPPVIVVRPHPYYRPWWNY
jgi:hypothetical protein